MSTPLIVLASILAFLALILIPVMMFRSDQLSRKGEEHPPERKIKEPRRNMNRKKR